MSNNSLESRKLDHIDMCLSAQMPGKLMDSRFFYEPLFSAHPSKELELSTFFLGKKLRAPLWISSMTGGVGPARHINQNLARLAREFGLGMGLGSCRSLLGDDTYFEDFNLRPILGDDLPFFANLGLAQVEVLVRSKKGVETINALLNRLEADGLIVHINPLQEWFQKEGDRYQYSPLETITELCSVIEHKIIVKEVGQGLGPKSLRALFDLPIAAIETASFGGTNFTRLEQMRGHVDHSKALSRVGHSAYEMVSFLNEIKAESKNEKCPEVIISGGIEDALDGHYLRENLKLHSVIGHAKNFLVRASDYSELKLYTEEQINTLKIARAYLVARAMESLC